MTDDPRLRFPDDITHGEPEGPAMELEDAQEAAASFEACVEPTMRLGGPREAAERIERENLGHVAGSSDRDTRQRVERLFHAAHPIFVR